MNKYTWVKWNSSWSFKIFMNFLYSFCYWIAYLFWDKIRCQLMGIKLLIWKAIKNQLLCGPLTGQLRALLILYFSRQNSPALMEFGNSRNKMFLIFIFWDFFSFKRKHGEIFRKNLYIYFFQDDYWGFSWILRR